MEPITINNMLCCWQVKESSILFTCVLELTSCLQLQITICTINMSTVSYCFWFLITISGILQKSQAMVSYNSLEPINATEPLAGLKLQKGSVEKSSIFTEGITICSRFNYRVLSKSIIFSIGSDVDNWKITARAGYDETFLFFWNINWIVKEPDTNKFRIWTTNRWHHICLSFNKSTYQLTLVKV